MRDLSVAEARVIRELLVDRPGPERLRRDAAGVPRSTYQAVQKKARVLGWIQTRYIPDPSSVGAHHLLVELAQPFAERRAEVRVELAGRDGLIVLWDCPDALFAVSFDRRGEHADNSPGSDLRYSRRWSVRPSFEAGAIRAFFDYEGAWSRWALNEPPRAYPRGLTTKGSEDISRGRASRREDLAELTSWALRAEASGPAGLWPFRRALPGKLQRLVDEGQAVPRTMPVLEQIPDLAGARLHSVVFVSGVWAPSGPSEQLFQEIVEESRATPFLYVSDEERVMMALLAPARDAMISGRTPITAVLGRHLREIEVVREPLAAIRRVVDHRYDRLFPAR